jgi:hypothetical protein
MADAQVYYDGQYQWSLYMYGQNMKSFAYRRKLNDCCEKSNISKLNIHERTQVQKKHCTTLYTETNYSFLINAILKENHTEFKSIVFIHYFTSKTDGVVTYCKEACRDSD